MALLEQVGGRNVGQKFAVSGDRAVLGRAPDCDIVLEEAAVSRRHARIVRDTGDYFLEDMGSRNGTYLNGQMIRGRERLAEGDRVDICDLSFSFYLVDPSERAARLASGESSFSLLLEDAAERTSSSTIMSKVDVSSSRASVSLAVQPEVKLKALLEIAQNLGRALNLEEVLSKLLDSLFKIFLQADRGFVVLVHPDDGSLVPKAIKHRRADDAQTIRVSRTIVQQAMEAGQAILSADATNDSRFDMAQSIADFQIRSMMCAPLLDSEGKPLGVIQIDALQQRTRFAEEDLELLASVASQAAVAVENAQLHEQTLRQRELERDLELAHQVQRGLVPAGPPELAGYDFFHHYVAARQVGGDYFDYVPLGGNRLAVVVADVSGKGVAAALLMAKLSGEVRYRLASEPDLAKAVRQINEVMARRAWDDRFVTFLATIIDGQTGLLTSVNAGHMAPIVRMSRGGLKQLGTEDATGLPLGVMSGYPYEATVERLEPGDLVVVFTDGISEAMNGEGELYGIERIGLQVSQGTVSAEETGRRILDDLRAFVAGQSQSDDMCLACFGRR